MKSAFKKGDKVLVHWGFPGDADYHTDIATVEDVERKGVLYIVGPREGRPRYSLRFYPEQLIGSPGHDEGSPIRYEAVPS